ncbi:hypothetical protein AVEN_36123-1 [Araneus ventricosus]|uniref:Uncharacterized protein n=1 Tax=Araneus ventricosus TaxID=182803 RepID=A0A4Y2F2C3_ARAVE|nr:hypothetical protein AVEN_36123-1 [Araneus ventricosus]
MMDAILPPSPKKNIITRRKYSDAEQINRLRFELPTLHWDTPNWSVAYPQGHAYYWLGTSVINNLPKSKPKSRITLLACPLLQ